MSFSLLDDIDLVSMIMIVLVFRAGVNVSPEGGGFGVEVWHALVATQTAKRRDFLINSFSFLLRGCCVFLLKDVKVLTSFQTGDEVRTKRGSFDLTEMTRRLALP